MEKGWPYACNFTKFEYEQHPQLHCMLNVFIYILKFHMIIINKTKKKLIKKLYVCRRKPSNIFQVKAYK